MNRRTIIATLLMLFTTSSSAEEFTQFIPETVNGMFSTKTEILLFSATWCGPCQSLKAQLKREGLYDKVKLMDCSNGGTFSTLSKKYGFRAVPTVIVLRNGKEVARGGLSTVRKYAK